MVLLVVCSGAFVLDEVGIVIVLSAVVAGLVSDFWNVSVVVGSILVDLV
jgi:hypothetical protein